MKVFTKLDQVSIGYVVGCGITGALIAGLMILDRKTKILSKEIKVMLGMQQCELMLIDSLNKEVEEVKRTLSVSDKSES